MYHIHTGKIDILILCITFNVENFISYQSRLIATIEVAQKHIQNVIDADMTIEEKIYGTMDITSDLEELTALHKELESHPDAGSNADDMKKAKIGLINLKAHLNQVDCEQFATFLRNTFLFKVIRSLSFIKELTSISMTP